MFNSIIFGILDFYKLIKVLKEKPVEVVLKQRRRLSPEKKPQGLKDPLHINQSEFFTWKYPVPKQDCIDPWTLQASQNTYVQSAGRLTR